MEVLSAGTGATDGLDRDAMMLEVAAERGYEITGKTKRADYFSGIESDLILCMEEYNIRNLRRVLGDNIMQHDAALPQPKIRRLLNRDVADPWYTGDFEATYQDVVEGAMRLLGY